MIKNKNVQTFIGADNEYHESTIVLFGCPFDGTTSYRPGARFAPAAIRNESYGIETYSPYQDKDLIDICVYDGGDLEIPFGNTEKVLGITEKYVEEILEDRKTPIMIGGEHLVTLAAVRAVTKKIEDIHIIHFDAHSDLREEYLGEVMSHASVMRRCYDIVGDNRIYQFGVRSGDREEFLFSKNRVYTNKFNLDTLDTIIEEIKDKPIYLTIDLDVLDPSEFPGTGTPEAGGISFLELLHGILKVSKLNIVGVDICELSPVYDQSGRSTALACKLLREILLSINKQ